jgi:hypothetical protein
MSVYLVQILITYKNHVNKSGQQKGYEIYDTIKLRTFMPKVE